MQIYFAQNTGGMGLKVSVFGQTEEEADLDKANFGPILQKLRYQAGDPLLLAGGLATTRDVIRGFLATHMHDAMAIGMSWWVFDVAGTMLDKWKPEDAGPNLLDCHKDLAGISARAHACLPVT